MRPAKLRFPARSLCLLIALLLPSCCATTRTPALAGTLFQVGSIDHLLKGKLDGPITLAQLQQHGDHGIGTFDGLDGEFVLVNGHAYQADRHGQARSANPDLGVPFAAVTRFEPALSVDIGPVPNSRALGQAIAPHLADADSFYALRVRGRFRHITYRSVAKQQRPYAGLAAAVASQTVIEREGIAGDLVGFYCPGSVGTINAPGFHFHWVDADRATGGHVLDVEIDAARVEIQPLQRLDILVPPAR